jgi:hypothetical protein
MGGGLGDCAKAPGDDGGDRTVRHLQRIIHLNYGFSKKNRALVALE